ncbi:hypothetical protein [Coraliomargarita parva]|uniref:hypothetical protein n=1 Tax=Coraliomargarita parva TaxID=3014050 RepID=UPI0022B55E61|nr:hypothetical protein [Coraliomargarita parva]
MMKFPLIFAFCLLSSFSLVHELVASKAPMVFDPMNKPYLELKSEDGKSITAQILKFDHERGLVKIRLKDQSGSMWFSPELLSPASRAELNDWRMIFLISEQLHVQADRSNESRAPDLSNRFNRQPGMGSHSRSSNTTSSGGRFFDETMTTSDRQVNVSGASYDLELRNYSQEQLRDITIRTKIVVKSAGGSYQVYDDFIAINQLSGGETTYFRTKPAEMSRTKSKTTSTVTRYDSLTGGTNTSSSSTSVKSSRSSLKGIAIRVCYKDVVVQEIFSERSLNEHIDW